MIACSYNIAIEEFSHLEMVGKLVAQHTSKIDQTSVYEAPLFKVKGGGPHFLDSQGSCWTAAYIQEGGNVVRDLRANISAEAGARQTYEALIKACDDEGTKKTLTHLLTREITHANMFMKALDAMGKLTDPMFGTVAPDNTVKLVFNLSHGEDVRGPWNDGPEFEYVANPEPIGVGAEGGDLQRGRRYGSMKWMGAGFVVGSTMAAGALLQQGQR